MGASSFTALEIGVTVGSVALINAGIATAGYEVGLGSLLSAAIWPDWPPCDDNDNDVVEPWK